MSAGRSQRVIISCVTYEVYKVVSPIKYYNASRVYLIQYPPGKDFSEKPLLSDFNDKVISILKDAGADPIIRTGDIYDYASMLKIMVQIVKKEIADHGKKIDIRVNISAGTHEFAAAAAICASLFQNVDMFTVKAKDTINTEKYREAISCNGELTGLVHSVYDPLRYAVYLSDPPESNHMLCLAVLYNLISNNMPHGNKVMIEHLKEKGLWTYVPARNAGRDMPQKESMYYQRHYLTKWEMKGWIERDEQGKIKITESGKAVLDAFSPQ